MSGILKIHSNPAGDWSFGHSWIEYQSAEGKTRTFGTWGNNPTGKGNGMFENLELGRSSEATRTSFINNKQEQKMFEKIADYQKLGEQAWTLRSPCSTFAADVWQHTTGEQLPFKSSLVSNPSTLASSIKEANEHDMQLKSGVNLTPQSPLNAIEQDEKNVRNMANTQARKHTPGF